MYCIFQIIYFRLGSLLPARRWHLCQGMASALNSCWVSEMSFQLQEFPLISRKFSSGKIEQNRTEFHLYISITLFSTELLTLMLVSFYFSFFISFQWGTTDAELRTGRDVQVVFGDEGLSSGNHRDSSKLQRKHTANVEHEDQVKHTNTWRVLRKNWPTPF